MIASPTVSVCESVRSDILPPEALAKIATIFDELESLEVRADELRTQAEQIIDKYAAQLSPVILEGDQAAQRLNHEGKATHAAVLD